MPFFFLFLDLSQSQSLALHLLAATSKTVKTVLHIATPKMQFNHAVLCGIYVSSHLPPRPTSTLDIIEAKAFY